MIIDNRLATAVRLALAGSLAGIALGAHAQNAGSDRTLETVLVSASAVNEDAGSLAASYSILDSEKLFERSQATLGDTLNSLPGVSADTFGGGSSRPVIRGQTAPRVAVLSDSAILFDASDISPDHAVTTEPLLIDRVEVLRGPATLLYGSGAIGGIVNVLDKKIPSALPENRIDGSVGVRGSSVAEEKAGAFEITAQATDNLVFHAEAALRDADDYRARGLDESHVDGTYAESENASLGVSWVTDRGYIGLAYSYRDDRYGIAGHSHEYEGCHPHGSALHCGDHEEGEGEEHEHEEGEHEEVPEISLLSKRVDLRGQLHEPFAGVERIRLRASHTDYRHYELEEEQVATTFLNDGYEARIEVQHAPLGVFQGVVGVQYTDTESAAIGEEAFLPTVQSRALGLFAVEHVEVGEQWHFELGARHEWQKHEPVNDERNRPEFDDSATSVSAAAIWEFVPDYSLTLALTRSERSPHAQELYARGIHLATNTYECGLVPHPFTCGGLENNASLETETSNNAELTLKKLAGDFTFSVGAFRNDVDEYIYARTLDQFEDFRLIKYTQADAEFTGVEAEATYRVSESFSATVFGDFVRAELADGGGNLPRIPAARYGTRLNARAGALGGEIEYYRVNEQDDIADFEAVTPSYDMLNLTLSFSPSEGSYSVYVRGTNLLDEIVWNHASYLAHVVPLPGRGVTAGMKLSF